MNLRDIKRVIVLSTAMAGVSGCHTPSGGLLSKTGGSHTYYSTEMMQKTVTLVDLRSDAEIFSIDIPPGKQLTIDFDAGKGDDPVYTPDIMRWEIFDQGKSFGKLHNAVTVPNAASRRVDVTLRRGIQYPPGVAGRPLRTDEIVDRPEWWTPQGGPLPEERVVNMYDD